MKNTLLIAFVFTAALLGGCIKEEVKTYTGKPALEFDAAVLNSPASGVKFPLLARVPKYGLTAVTADPAITRASGTVKFRINLVGPQSSASQVINYKVVSADFKTALDVTSGSGQRLSAVQGTHFNTSGTCTIPASSSFGEIEITVINPGATSTVSRYLVLEIDGNGSFSPSENYKRIGILIAQS